MKKIIKLTENDVHNIIEESVKQILKENKTAIQLQNIIQQLTDITTSGYIPFASPAPSSTEQIVKDNILTAINCLNKALQANNELYQ